MALGYVAVVPDGWVGIGAERKKIAVDSGDGVASIARISPEEREENQTAAE